MGILLTIIGHIFGQWGSMDSGKSVFGGFQWVFMLIKDVKLIRDINWKTRRGREGDATTDVKSLQIKTQRARGENFANFALQLF